MIVIILICIMVYGIYKSLTPSNSNSNYNSSYNNNAKNIYNEGEFASGFYMEEINVFVKGPVYSYGIDTHLFYGYGEGELNIKNSTGDLKIILEQSISDNRILPTSFLINNKLFSVIDKTGNFINENVDLADISVARTINYIINEQIRFNMDENTQLVTYQFLMRLLIFNLLIKRSIILNYTNRSIQIGNEYYHNRIQEFIKYEKIATDLIDKYQYDYLKSNTINIIEKLLTILELPKETRDIDKVRKQYKLLAKNIIQTFIREPTKNSKKSIVPSRNYAFI